MKRKNIVYATLLAVLISACGAQATPTIDGLSVQNTSVAAAFTLVAQTQEALPTNTLLPPTDISTETPVPTNTLEPTTTLDLTCAPTFLAPTGLPTLAPTSTTSSNNNCNHAITSWIVPTATFTIVNETQPKGTIILLLSVLTKTGDCGWINILSTKFSGPMGSYSAAAFVDGKKSFKVFGTFYATPQGWKIIVRNDRIALQNACYPNC